MIARFFTLANKERRDMGKRPTDLDRLYEKVRHVSRRLYRIEIALAFLAGREGWTIIKGLFV